MGIPLTPNTFNFTYANLNSKLITWIQQNCQNIVNYNAIDAAFKPNWTSPTVYEANTYPQGHFAYYNNTYKPFSNGNYVVQISAQQVSNDFTPYINTQLQNIGINPNDMCSVTGIQSYYNFLINFTSSKIFYAMSVFKPSLRYLVYTTNPISGAINLPSIIIERSDVYTLLTNMINSIKRATRTTQVQYGYIGTVPTYAVGTTTYIVN